MRQGNDVGTTYRSTIYAHTQEQLDQALRSKDEYQKVSLNRPFISLPSIYKQPSGDQFVSQWFKTGLASGSRHYIGHQAPKAKMSLKILLVAWKYYWHCSLDLSTLQLCIIILMIIYIYFIKKNYKLYKITNCISKVKNKTLFRDILGKTNIAYKGKKNWENKFNYLTNNLLKICILVNVFKNLY